MSEANTFPTATRTSAAGPAAAAARLRQNWILDPLQDALLIIGTPAVALVFALGLFYFRPGDAISWLNVVYIVATVAHHFPTFLRIYGDVELFRRFKWTFIFGPLVPFTFALGVLGFLQAKDQPIDHFFYLFIILTLWDPWHFLMQHYGFMRIYDHPNAAPRRLSARMDFALCATWFVYTMIASGDWLQGLLEDLYTQAHVPLIFLLSSDAVTHVEQVAFVAAAGVSVGYAVYLVWCYKRGFFVSAAKVALALITFATMYLAYTPNRWILALAPAWSFRAGFCVIGIMHVTQYLAIVWRYNRSLAAKNGRARPGFFRALHARGGVWVVGGYVLLCLAYGELLTTVHANRWLMTFLLAAGFTSTLMHYYFDGFIWKVRHQQNRENLSISSTAASNAATSASEKASTPNAFSWDALKSVPASLLLFRQLIYFALPMAVLTVGAWWAWKEAPPPYTQLLLTAHRLQEAGQPVESRRAVEAALDAMDRQLPLVRKLAELRPTSAHEAALAFLIYSRSVSHEMLLPELNGYAPKPEHIAQHRAKVLEAISVLDHALKSGGTLGHAGRENLSPAEAAATLQSWRRMTNENNPERFVFMNQ